MSRRVVGGGVIALWLAGIGMLVGREYFGRPVDLDSVVLNVNPGAAYHALMIDGTQVGVVSSTIDTLGTDVSVQDLLLVDLPADTGTVRASARTVATLSRALRLRRFETGVRGPLDRFIVRGRVEGDTALAVTIVTANDSSHSLVPLDGPLLLPQVLPLAIAFDPEREPGVTLTHRVFDPLLLHTRAVRSIIGRDSTFVFPDSAGFDPAASRWIPLRWDTVTAFRVDQVDGGMARTLWIEPSGAVAHTEEPAGVVGERVAFELAYENFRRPDLARPRWTPDPGMVFTTAVAAGVPLSQTVGAGPRHYRIDAVDPAAYAALQGEGQEFENGTLRLVRDTSALRADYRLPADSALGPDALRPAPLISSRDARIAAQARQVVGRGRDPTRAARRLTAWVHQTLRKEFTPSAPDAVQTLERRRGDANEHTTLLVALARAAGLPARPVSGLLLVADRFYPHSWVEFKLGEWTPADPTMGQFPADAAHVRLAVDRITRPIDYIRLIGRLRIRSL